MPTTVKGLYRDGVCWSHIGKSDIQCGLDAKEYVATRVGFGLEFTSSIDVRVWLCQIHKEKSEADGYTLTLVPK